MEEEVRERELALICCPAPAANERFVPVRVIEAKKRMREQRKPWEREMEMA